MNPETIGFAMGMQLFIMSAAHDHLYSRGERKTTFFKWTGTNFSLLLMWAEILRKGDAKPKPKQKR